MPVTGGILVFGENGVEHGVQEYPNSLQSGALPQTIRELKSEGAEAEDDGE